jgi:acyl-CoA synthetase (AMP-forming)/AMP-acid ligase II
LPQSDVALHGGASNPVSQRLQDVLAGGGDRPAIEFRGHWYSWHDLKDRADAVFVLLDDAGLPPEAAIGLIARNRLDHAALILGCAARGRSLSMIYAYQSPEALATDLAALKLRAVVADRQDWAGPAIAAARSTGTVGIEIGERAVFVDGLEVQGAGPFRPNPAAPCFEVLSSGTTGPPKRVPIPMTALSQFVTSFTLGERLIDQLPPVIHTAPFGTVGFSGLIGRAAAGVRIVLLEKFSIDEWVEAVRRHRPTSGSASPPIVRSILAADVPREDLASIAYIFGGAGVLEPETQLAFEQRYGIPILWGYGATEFAGTAASWTPALRAEFEGRKLGSVGRAISGVEIRITDFATGAALPPGEAGRLEAKVSALREDWIKTTDLASIDEDGFVFVHGRDDGAIVRGGFKILPERVVAVLRRHPDVMDAVVIGMPDKILGEVPVAAVEARPGQAPTIESLEAQVRATLPAHHVPKRFLVVSELPRNASLKVDMRAARRLFDPASTHENGKDPK